ncbi:MAG TPA: hypothetical protein VFA53_09545 [Xanthobacteraceae bacterium]|nr:hypothetical protein [Xanthobacteraceae bacterium]
MRKKSALAGTLSALATLCAVSAAEAQCLPCQPVHQPGMLDFMVGLFTPGRYDCARCSVTDQHDYIVDEGPDYSGPALIAPEPTYAPSPLSAGYPYVSGYVGAPRYRVASVIPPARKVTVKRTPAKARTEVIRARAVVKIYGPERMDIRLYRNK